MICSTSKYAVGFSFLRGFMKCTWVLFLVRFHFSGLKTNLWTVKMAKMAMENCVQILISNYEWDTEHKRDFEMGWKWIIDSVPSVRPFLGEEMLLMDPEKNESHHFLKLCLRLRCGTILAMKLTNMQKQGLHNNVS